MQWTTSLAPWTVNELRADARCRVTFHTIRVRKKFIARERLFAEHEQ
jgi:hypothetical protein